MCCSLFLDCVLQALGSACVQTDGCAINLAVSPVRSLPCKASTYLCGSFTSSKRSALSAERKNPLGSHFWSDSSLLLFQKEEHRSTNRKSLFCSSSYSILKKFFRPAFAKRELGNKRHLKARDGLLTPDPVWRSPCSSLSSLWFRVVFIICLLIFFVFCFFFFLILSLS